MATDDFQVEINGVIITKDEVRKEFPLFLNEVLFNSELEALNTFEEKTGFSFIDFVVSNIDILKGFIEGNTFIIPQIITKLVALEKNLKLPDSEAEQEELQVKISNAFPGIMMGFYFYAQGNGDADFAPALSKMFRKFVNDFSLRVSEPPPPFISEVIARLDVMEGKNNIDNNANEERNKKVELFILKVEEKFGSIDKFIEHSFSHRDKLMGSVQLIINNGNGNAVNTGNESLLTSMPINADKENLLRLLSNSGASDDNIKEFLNILNQKNRPD